MSSELHIFRDTLDEVTGNMKDPNMSLDDKHELVDDATTERDDTVGRQVVLSKIQTGDIGSK